MAKFGWSYPPGCSGTPYDDELAPSDLVESVRALMEEAEAPEAICDLVEIIIEKWERGDSGEHDIIGRLRRCVCESGATSDVIAEAIAEIERLRAVKAEGR